MGIASKVGQAIGKEVVEGMRAGVHGAEHAAQKGIGKGGRNFGKNAVKDGEEGAKEATEKTAKDRAKSKKSLFSRATTFAGNHKKGLLIGGAVAGVAGLGLAGDDGAIPRTVDDVLGHLGVPGTDDVLGGSNTPGGDGAGHGEIEIDTEVLQRFALELRHAADHLHGAPEEMQQSVEAMVKHFSEDGAGAKTRDGNPAPYAASLVEVAGKFLQQYEAMVHAIIQQFTHDAEALDDLCKRHEDHEHEAKRRYEDIDANVGAAV